MDLRKPRRLSVAAAEARRTWGGRCLRGWLGIASALLALAVGSVLLAPWDPFTWLGANAWSGEPLFHTAYFAVWAMGCWIPAWLGSDLLASADPSYSPSKWAARLTGRLVPFCTVLSLLAAILTGGFLRSWLAESPIDFAYAFEDRTEPSVLAAVWTWPVWTLAIVSCAAPYALGGVIASALARHPRRWIIAPFVVICGSALLGLPLSLANRAVESGGLPLGIYASAPGLFDHWIWAVLVPSYAIGAMGAVQVTDPRFLGSVLPGSDEVRFLFFCASTTLFFLMLSVGELGLIRLILYCRHRRNFRRHSFPEGTSR
ncbi:MAG: hypothetical protein ACK47B_11310 [Armatimonadota bacterium]